MAYVAPKPAYRRIGRLTSAHPTSLITYVVFALAFAFTAAFVLGLVR